MGSPANNPAVRELASQIWRNPLRPGARQELEAVLTENVAWEGGTVAQVCLALAQVCVEQDQDAEAAERYLELGVEVGPRAMEPLTWARLQNALGFVRWSSGRLPDAVAPLTSALRAGLQHDHPHEVRRATSILAEVVLALGDPIAALAILERIPSVLDEPSPTARLELVWLRFRIGVALGNGAAATIERDALVAEPGSDVRSLAIRKILSAMVDLQDGRAQMGLDTMSQLLAYPTCPLVPLERQAIALVLADTALSRNDVELAARFNHTARHAVDRYLGTAYDVQALRQAGKLAQRQGDLERAVEVLDQAASLVQTQDRGLTGHVILNTIERHLEEAERTQATLEVAHRAVRSAAERLELITDALPLQIGHVGPDGRVRFANARMVAAFAAKTGQLIGASMWELLQDPAYAVLREGLQQALNGGKATHAQEIEVLGSLRSLEITWLPATAPDSGAYVLVQDVTERREQERLELELLRAQRLESLGVMAGGIAHDFNNLLTSIIGNLGLTQGLVPDPSVEEALDDAMTAARRAAALTHQLLVYTGRGRVAPQPVDLNRLVSQACELVAMGTSKPPQITQRLAIHSIPAHGDDRQLVQVCVNLLRNAVEALPPNGGTVRVSTGMSQHDGSPISDAHPNPLLPAGNYAWFEVRDQGTGMLESHAKRVFEPFYTTKGAGRGLGLAACLGIVRSHQGRVVFRSEPGLGTTVRVWLPMHDHKRSSSAPPVAMPRQASVLVVDDDPMIRRFFMRHLSAAGLQVRSAENGQDGVRVFRDHPNIDLVILDLTMPVMDGEQMLRILREDSDVPVILISGYSKAHIQPLLGEGGANAFLTKPITVDVLWKAVAQQLTASSSR